MKSTAGIRRWALLTVILYGVTLAALLAPMAFVAFGEDPRKWRQLGELYAHPVYWIVIAVLMALQALFLFSPLNVVRERPIGRRRWSTLAISAGLMMALLLMGLGVAVWETFKLEPFESAQWPLVIGACIWFAWSLIFYRYARRDRSASAVGRLIDRMLVGSVAELLIAIPCHVIVRQRDDCCAGFGTFMGLAAGFSVLLFAFGPGVFFLFVARARGLRRAAELEETDAPETELRIRARHMRHTRNSLFWSFGIFMSYAMVYGSTIWLGQDSGVLFHAMRATFVLLSLISCWQAFAAFCDRETGWRYAVMSAVLLLECVVATILL
jgi:hypothetical protein